MLREKNRICPKKFFNCPYTYNLVCGSVAVAQWLGSRNCNQQVAGSNPGRRLPRCRMQPWASCLHTCASVTKQYNLVPANEQ